MAQALVSGSPRSTLSNTTTASALHDRTETLAGRALGAEMAHRTLVGDARTTLEQLLT